MTPDQGKPEARTEGLRCDYLMPANGMSPNFNEYCECILPYGHDGPHRSMVRGALLNWEHCECGCGDEDCSCFTYWSAA